MSNSEDLCEQKKNLLSKYSEKGQANYFVKRVISEAYEVLKNKNDTELDRESCLYQAEDLASDVVSALDETGGNYWEQGSFFSHLDSDGLKEINFWNPPSIRFSIFELNDVTKKYLQLDWLSLPVIEWYLVSAYLKYCIYTNFERSVESRIGPIKNLILLSFQNHITKSVIWSLLNILGFIINWFVLPITASMLAIYDHGTAALILFAIFGLQILARIIHIPKAIANWKARRDLAKYIQALISLQFYVNSKVFSPTELMNRVMNLETEHGALVQEMRALAAKMQKRDREIFTI